MDPLKGYQYSAITGNLASKDGLTYTYGDTNHKHAVTALSDGSLYTYDANGNMLTRTVGGQTFSLTHDAEGRLVSVAGAATASFGYNGDGQRVISTEGGTTTVFIGNYFEWTGSVSIATKYYYAGAVRVAMRKGAEEPLFLLGDHLGSTSKIVHEDGTPLAPGGVRLYKSWGELRHEPDGALATKYRYTGQFEEFSDSKNELYNYGARFYDPALGCFIQADTIIPEASQGTQAWDRFAGMNNNPIKYNDPSGHCIDPSQCPAFALASTTASENTPKVAPPDYDNVAPEDNPPPPSVDGLPDEEWEWNANWPDLGRGYRNRSDPSNSVWRPDRGYNNGKEGENAHWHKRTPGQKNDETFPDNYQWGRGPDQRKQPGSYNEETGRYDTVPTQDPGTFVLTPEDVIIIIILIYYMVPSMGGNFGPAYGGPAL